MRRRKIVDETATPNAAPAEDQSASGERDVAASNASYTRDQEIARLQDEAVQRTRAAAQQGVRTPACAEDVGEPVSVTWGEELYTPQQFFTFRIGPFSRQTKIRVGETAVMAKARVESELEQMAAAERKKKMTIFLDTMKELFETVKKYQAVKS